MLEEDDQVELPKALVEKGLKLILYKLEKDQIAIYLPLFIQEYGPISEELSKLVKERLKELEGV